MTTIEQLKAERAALPSVWDVVGSRAQEAVSTRGRVLDACIDAHDNAANRLAGIDADLAPRIMWRDHLVAWRPILADQLRACPPTADTREAEYTRLGLEISLRSIDSGFDFGGEMFPPNLQLFALMQSAGYVAPPTESWNLWRAGYGSLPQVAQRIAELQQQRSIAEQQLAAALRDPVTA